MQAPPTLRQLLAFPIYKAYFKTPPQLPDNVELRHPFQVWAYNGDANRWGSRLCTTYRDAYMKTLQLYRTPGYDDIAIVSRTILCPMPKSLRRNGEFIDAWADSYDWCKRCRRPTIFQWSESHRALKAAPVVTTDEAHRCYYCGVRKVFAGESMAPRRRPL
jgi:hypothetical protein